MRVVVCFAFHARSQSWFLSTIHPYVMKSSKKDTQTLKTHGSEDRLDCSHTILEYTHFLVYTESANSMWSQPCQPLAEDYCSFVHPGESLESGPSSNGSGFLQLGRSGA